VLERTGDFEGPLNGENAARFTPSLAHAERTVRLLTHYYPKKTSAECQEALAGMYGHADWGSLQSMLQNRDALSAFDEDVAPEIVGARFQQQYDVALARLAGMTDETMLAAQALDQEVLSTDLDSISKRYHPAFNGKRRERARYAWNLSYTRHAILEIRPTARDAVEIAKDRDDIEMSFRVDLLPRALKAWLSHHRPLLREWGERIGEMPVRQHAPTDLLNFSFLWGEVCLDCAVEIPKPLQIYPVALCAKWFAWIACSRAPHVQRALTLLGTAGAAEAAKERAEKLVADTIRDEEARFILAQPREDFRSHSASAREQHINAGYAMVRRCISNAATESTVKDIMTRTFWPAISPAMHGG
jgi:hypothetical protein